MCIMEIWSECCGTRFSRIVWPIWIINTIFCALLIAQGAGVRIFGFETYKNEALSYFFVGLNLAIFLVLLCVGWWRMNWSMRKNLAWAISKARSRRTTRTSREEVLAGEMEGRAHVVELEV